MSYYYRRFGPVVYAARLGEGLHEALGRTFGALEMQVGLNQLYFHQYDTGGGRCVNQTGIQRLDTAGFVNVFDLILNELPIKSKRCEISIFIVTVHALCFFKLLDHMICYRSDCHFNQDFGKPS